MKTRSLYKAVIVLPLLLSFLSCTKVSDQQVILYYSDPQSMYFIPVTTTMKLKGNIDSISKPKEIIPILNELKVSKDSKSLKSSIPEGINFKDIELIKDKKEIDITLDTEKKRLGEAQEQMMVGAIVNTLTELNEFNLVKINPGNLQSEMDYSEPISRDIYRNSWLMSDEIGENNSMGVVYWYSKDKKYLVPVTVPIIKNDVTSLLKALENGPKGSRKNYFENSINKQIDILIKAVNLNHIDIELKNKQNVPKKVFEEAKKAILMSISELNVFDTVKFITPDMGEELIDLRKSNPRKNLNKIEFTEQQQQQG